MQIIRKKNPSEFTAKENGIDAHRLIETLKFADAHRAQVADPNFDEDDKLSEVRNSYKLKLAVCWWLVTRDKEKAQLSFMLVLFGNHHHRIF